MEVKLKDIINSYESIDMVGGVKFSAKFSFKIMKIKNELKTHVVDYEEIRTNKIKEYGTPSKDTDGKYTFDDGLEAKVINELAELSDEIINVSFSKIKIEEFGDVEIEPNLLMPLLWLIED